MVANNELQRVGLRGWRTGLANLLHKENRTWWASRRWLVQSVLWTIVVNGAVALFMFLIPLLARNSGQPLVGMDDPLKLGLEMLFKLGPLALAVGTIVLVQDTIIGERQMGVTEWLLSKPVARSSYLLAKLLANGLGVLVILVGLQSAVGYGLLWLAAGSPFPLPYYLVGVAGLAVHTLFYLALSLMMGVLTAKRSVLLGTSLGVLLGGLLLGGFLGTLVMLTPWGLGSVLPYAVQGTPLPLPIWVPIGVTALMTVGCVVVALVRFERLEF
jgi:ABC-type transport system involved in multi-copper enzyme maturation permease subunit